MIYVGKAKSIRKRVASHFGSGRGAAYAGHTDLPGQIESIETVVTATEAEAFLAEQEFIQRYRPRFNIRLRDDKSYPYIGISLDETSRACTSRASATAATAPTSGRTGTPRRRARRSTCWARSSSSAPATAPSPAAARARPASTTTSSAARRPCVGYVDEQRTGGHRRRHGLPVRPLPPHRARARAAHARRRRRAGSSRPRSSATACARSARCSSASASPARRWARSTRSPSPSRARRQRAGLPGPRRRALRPAVLLPRQRGRARARRGDRGVHPPVLRQRHVDPAADHRPARPSEPVLADALAPPRGRSR